MGSLKNWFLALSNRERVLIAILGFLILGMAGFYGIVRPFSTALDAAEEQYLTAVERRGRIESKVAALQESFNKNNKPTDANLETVISQSAGEAGFAVEKLDLQSDGRVNMAIGSAKPVALFGWLSKLERRGVLAELLNVKPKENGTISANLTLRSIIAN